MKISVITVVFNGVLTIQDSIDSVMNQDACDYEHIIVDGNSTDGTLKIVQHYLDSGIILISEPDKGIYDAMNKGIQLASGDVVGFLNSDDVYYNQTILNQVHKVFKSDTSLEIVYGDLVYVRQQNLDSVVRLWRGRAFDTRYFGDGQVPPHPSFFVKRKALLETGGFDLQFSLAADYELMFRLLEVEKRPSAYLSSTLVKMRLGGATNRSFTNIKRGNQEIVAAWRKHKKSIPLRFWLLRYVRKVEQFFS
jgi:glycosyltransferase involved in cell wall biosynthesis